MADFRSDNTHGASPEILEAVARANTGTVVSYGTDPFTARVEERCRELFEHDLKVFPVLTGTAGNSLSIASMTPPWGAVFCHEQAHIHRDEMGAPEFFSGGAKVFPVAGAHGKLTPEALTATIALLGDGAWSPKPSCVSVTEATEAGTVYTTDEMGALGEVARRFGCRVHMDGARFANAVVSSGATPAELSWKAGVDVLVFGGTKNGALAVEVIVAFDLTLAAELAIRWHRAGHRLSKMRFLSAQFEAYLGHDLWLRNARHANAMAARLAAGLGERVIHPVEANVVFARFPPELAASLVAQGFQFFDWPVFGGDAFRLVAGFDTAEDDVDALVRAVTSHSPVA